MLMVTYDYLIKPVDNSMTKGWHQTSLPNFCHSSSFPWSCWCMCRIECEEDEALACSHLLEQHKHLCTFVHSGQQRHFCLPNTGRNAGGITGWTVCFMWRIIPDEVSIIGNYWTTWRTEPFNRDYSRLIGHYPTYTRWRAFIHHLICNQILWFSQVTWFPR